MQRLILASRLAGWIAVLAIAVLSLVPGEMRPRVLSVSQVEHVLAYMAAGSTLTFGYFRRRNVAMIAALLPLYAALLEVLQIWVPGRVSRLIDVAAGTLGTWIGIGMILLIHRIVAIPTTSLDPPRSAPAQAQEAE